MAKERWISGLEAAQIMSANSRHEISTDYVRLLSNKGRIRARPKNGREKEYHLEDVKNYHVRENNVTKEQEKETAG